MIKKNEIIKNYYDHHFKNLCYTGFQRRGSRFIHKSLEKYWGNASAKYVMEVGAGNGEHLEFVDYTLSNGATNYIALDFRKPTINETQNQSKLNKINVIWGQGDIENLPFKNQSFDRVISTCLFLHLDNPLQAYEELKRVTKIKGELCIAYPTDPGLLNRFVKRFYTHRKAKKLGVQDIGLVSALEHRNNIHGLLEIQNHVFKDNLIRNHYLPFGLQSWNFNLLVISHIKII